MELRIKKWIPVIEEQAKSGMSKEAWCAMHGINRTSFFRWQKRVREYFLDQCEAQPSHHPSSVSSNNEVCFVELPSVQDFSAEMVEQRYEETGQACGVRPSISIRCGGFSIDFNDGVDVKQLSVVLRGLKYAD